MRFTKRNKKRLKNALKLFMNSNSFQNPDLGLSVTGKASRCVSERVAVRSRAHFISPGRKKKGAPSNRVDGVATRVRNWIAADPQFIISTQERVQNFARSTPGPKSRKHQYETGGKF